MKDNGTTNARQKILTTIDMYRLIYDTSDVFAGESFSEGDLSDTSR